MRYLVYFRRGHSVYLVLLVSLANFVVIQYRLLIQYVPALNQLFSELWFFTLVFMVLYVFLATFIGWLDYKKGSVTYENILLSEASPPTKDFAKALLAIAEELVMDEEKLELIRKHLAKYVKDKTSAI